MPGWATRKTAEEIRRLVRLGKAREGGQLPSERDLATALQVSRATVRAALRILRDEGEIETRSGNSSGTFVSKSNPLLVSLLADRGRSRAARSPASDGNSPGSRRVNRAWGMRDREHSA